MRTLIPVLAVLLLTLPAGAKADPFHYELRKIRDDIHVAVRPDVNRVPVTGNVTLIINEKDVIVVDSGVTPAAAENVIALLREKTPLPVSAVINTHWHDDHHLGNSAWKKHWPEAEFIAHENTRNAIAGEPMAGLDSREAELLEFQKTLADRVERKVDAQDNPLGESALARSRQTLATIPLLIEQARIVKLVVPDRVYTESLLLERPGRRIHVQYLGRGNTDGDSVVFLPDDEIVITGDLVVMPVPYGFYSYPSDWIATLERISALRWNTLVPGHGEPQTDRKYLGELIALLKDVRAQVVAGHAAGKTLEEIRSTIEPANAAYFTSGDPLLERLFRAYWITPITKSAWKEATGVEIVQGVDPV